MQALRAFMRAFEEYVGEAFTVYGHVATIHDGNDLVEMLKRAQRYNELVGAEKIPRDDWKESLWADA